MAIVVHPLETGTVADRHAARTRRGRPPRGRPPAIRATEQQEAWLGGQGYGSHMPLDIDIHWHWSNPLNLLPASFALLIAIALIALVTG